MSPRVRPSTCRRRRARVSTRFALHRCSIARSICRQACDLASISATMVCSKSSIRFSLMWIFCCWTKGNMSYDCESRTRMVRLVITLALSLPKTRRPLPPSNSHLPALLTKGLADYPFDLWARQIRRRRTPQQASPTVTI